MSEKLRNLNLKQVSLYCNKTDVYVKCINSKHSSKTILEHFLILVVYMILNLGFHEMHVLSCLAEEPSSFSRTLLHGVGWLASILISCLTNIIISY